MDPVWSGRRFLFPVSAEGRSKEEKSGSEGACCLFVSQIFRGWLRETRERQRERGRDEMIKEGMIKRKKVKDMGRASPRKSAQSWPLLLRHSPACWLRRRVFVALCGLPRCSRTDGLVRRITSMVEQMGGEGRHETDASPCWKCESSECNANACCQLAHGPFFCPPLLPAFKETHRKICG